MLWAGIVWAVADAASNSKAGIKRVFFTLSSGCGEKDSAGGRGCATELGGARRAACGGRAALGLDSRGRLSLRGRARRPSPHELACAILFTCIRTRDTGMLMGR